MKAFPTPQYREEKFNGMDLRDYFAAKAMQSLINEKYWHDPKGGIDEINIADDSYRMAIAMMKVKIKYDNK